MAGKAKLTEGRPVLITTEHRGVFFGYVDEAEITAWKSNPAYAITMRRARNCLYWPVANKGFLGLAEEGPLTGARVGPAAASLDLAKITAIVGVTDKAVEAWESAPWSR